MLNRRHLLLSALAPAIPLPAAPGSMQLCMHQTTSAAAGYRKSLEGYARAGIKYVEVVFPQLEPFVKTNGMPAARKLLSDLGLTAVSSGGVRGLWEPNPDRSQAIESMKRLGAMAAELGVDRLVCPSGATEKYTVDDYKRGVDNMREAGEIAKQIPITLMVEFMRGSTFLGTLPTSLYLTRQAAHPNVKPMIDCYHFWAGLSKFEDLKSIRAGEIWHVHFQDVADIPREMLDNMTREVPGEGVSPLPDILRVLGSKGYSGPVSVELFYPRYQNADPYEMARRIRDKAIPVMRAAGVA
ncbi:MAG: sugar phosphate isomerase/epimerase family protein [Bryobacteraceae bacterium]|jgi:2-keto-myo-inositol isomerase